MPLMGSLYIGASGLQTSQNALNTTAHNLSNVDTQGYTRQQVQQSSRSYIMLARTPNAVANKQTGLGVNYSRAAVSGAVRMDWYIFISNSTISSALFSSSLFCSLVLCNSLTAACNLSWASAKAPCSFGLPSSI